MDPAQGAALIRARMRQLGMSQENLGLLVAAAMDEEPVKQPGVNRWLKHPEMLLPERIFVIERVLGMAPGSVSQYWGYLPVTVRPIKTVEDAIRAEAEWPDAVRDALLAFVAATRKSLAATRKVRNGPIKT